MSTLQHAAVLHGAKDLRLETRPVHAPGVGQAQVALVCTGLCGSDHHYYTHGRNGDFRLQAPLVLGHEAAGIVTALGPGVSHLRIGQRVAVEPGVSCAADAQCKYCAEGRYNLCVNMSFCSSCKTFPHRDGTLQGYMNHPANLLFPLPEGCSFEAAALAEPLGVILHATRRASLSPGQSVLVFGVGAIGVLACAVAKAQGARRVCAIDINDARLEFAKSRGFADASMCLSRNSGPGAGEVDPLVRAKKTAMGALETFGETEGFDVVLECSGAEPCIQMGVFATRPGGKLVLVGMGTPQLTFPLGAAATREVDVLGVFRYTNTWPESLALLGSGKLPNIEDLVTHRLPLHRAREAFELVSKGVDSDGKLVMKVLVDSTTGTVDEVEGAKIQRLVPLEDRERMVACVME